MTGLVSDRLDLFPLEEWDEYNSYDENIPSRVRYSVEWKVVVNNRIVSKNSEQDVVLAPAAYWHLCLKSKVENLLSKMVPYGRHIEHHDTSVVTSVNDCSEREARVLRISCYLCRHAPCHSREGRGRFYKRHRRHFPLVSLGHLHGFDSACDDQIQLIARV